MSPPSASERRRVRGHGAARPLLLPSLLVALCSAHCTFPEFDIRQSGDAGMAGSGGNAGTSSTTSAQGGTPEPAQGGQAGSEMAMAGNMGEGGAFECRGEQWPVNQCGEACLRRFPDHCYDGQASELELDIDCGGDCQRCSDSACTKNTDCLSGQCLREPGSQACQAPFELGYSAHETNALVGSTAWSLSLLNAEAEGGRIFDIDELEIRYYFDRNGVTEPIVVRATQSNMQIASGESHALAGTSWAVERFLDDTDAVYNAYVAVRFADSGQLFPGDKISIYQQMMTGDPGNSMFDQRANYSYTKTATERWERVNVFYQGKLLWGLEPRPASPRACYVRGVNLNGPTLEINGNAWEGSSLAGVTTTGAGISQGNTPYPSATGNLATALATAIRLQAGENLEVPIAAGQYLVYLTVLSTTNDAAPGVLTVEGEQTDNGSKFRAQAVDAGWAWSRLGPYRTTIADGKLTVAVTAGTVYFAGVEVWYAD